MSRLISRAVRAARHVFNSRKATANSAPHPDAPVVLRFTVSANFVAQLRHMIIRACGDLLTFMRIAPIAHASRMRVWLCISQPATAVVLQAALRTIPGVEFVDIAPR